MRYCVGRAPGFSIERRAGEVSEMLSYINIASHLGDIHIGFYSQLRMSM